MRKFALSALSATFLLAMGMNAFGAPVSQAEYKSTRSDISTRYRTEKAACNTNAGNAKDICIEEAKGHEKVSRAELEASYSPSEKHNYQVRIAKADAAYAVAKEKCDDASGNTRDVCRKEAKAAYVTANANAKLSEKTSDNNADKREAIDAARTKATEKNAIAKTTADADKRKADYAVAKEKCDALAGDTKANCIKDAKALFGQN